MPADATQLQRLKQEMRQEQVMTHQQIQALELLFAPVLELQSIVSAEIEKNPVLETAIDDDPSEPVGNDADEWLDRILQLDEESRYIRSYRQSLTPEEEERRQHFLESVAVERNFQDLLIEQLRFLELDPKISACCEVVVSGLDDDGYLKSHSADLAMASGQDLPTVEKAIEIVKSLDPPGVGAADLRERLLMQLERSGRKDSPAYVAVRDHLSEIGNNQLPFVAKKMGLGIEELKKIIEEIQGLSPRLQVDAVDHSDYVREEVTVAGQDGQLVVKLNNDYLPSLRISKEYRRILEDPATTKEIRDYIKEKVKAGVFLINSIIQRQTTIKKIVTAIVEMQDGYFRSGPEKMRPMTMAEVASKAGVHETTVSRAVAGKYLRCRIGLVHLRDLFSSGYEMEDGVSVSKNVVIDQIKRLVDNEDERKPLSDSEIVDKLKERGYTIARRTIVKYREIAGIPPSNLRKKY